MDPQQRLYFGMISLGSILALLLIQINHMFTDSHWVADIIIWTFFVAVVLTGPSYSEIEEYRRKKYGKS